MIYRIHDAHQKVVMGQKEMNPFIESGLRYLIEITKLRNRAVPDKVAAQDNKYEPDGIRTVRNQNVRKDSMSMPAVTFDARHRDLYIRSVVINNGDHSSLIAGVKAMAMRTAARRAGAVGKVKLSQACIKKLFIG